MHTFTEQTWKCCALKTMLKREKHERNVGKLPALPSYAFFEYINIRVNIILFNDHPEEMTYSVEYDVGDV